MFSFLVLEHSKNYAGEVEGIARRWIDYRWEFRLKWTRVEERRWKTSHLLCLNTIPSSRSLRCLMATAGGMQQSSQRTGYGQLSKKQKGFHSNDDLQVVKAIKKSFLETHRCRSNSVTCRLMGRSIYTPNEQIPTPQWKDEKSTDSYGPFLKINWFLRVI